MVFDRGRLNNRRFVYVLGCCLIMSGCGGIHLTKPTTLTKDSPINFPFDEGKHDNAWIEWWYYAGWLQDRNGGSYTYELVFFKVTESVQILRRLGVDIAYFAHFAISDVTTERHKAAERALVLLSPEVKINKGYLDLQYDDWGAVGNTESCQERYYHIWADDSEMAIDLDMKGACSPILGNGAGVIDMGKTGFSRAYSIPRLETTGHLVIDGKEYSVSGCSWADHQWGNWGWYEPFGWNWWGVNLDNGVDLIVYDFPDSTTTVIAKYPDGSQIVTSEVTLEKLGWWKSPETGTRYPIEWRFEIPDLDAELLVSPTFPDQEMTTRLKYWEGGCVVKGKMKQEEITGKGYMELVGYNWTDFSFLRWGVWTILSGLFSAF